MTDDKLRGVQRRFDAGEVDLLDRLCWEWEKLGPARGPDAPLAVQLRWLTAAYPGDALGPGVTQAWLPDRSGTDWKRETCFYASIVRWLPPDANHRDRPWKHVTCNATGPTPAAALRGLLELWHGPFDRGRRKGTTPYWCQHCLGCGLDRKGESCICASLGSATRVPIPLTESGGTASQDEVEIPVQHWPTTNPDAPADAPTFHWTPEPGAPRVTRGGYVAEGPAPSRRPRRTDHRGDHP